MIAVQVGNSEDMCHINDDSEKDMQSNHEDDILPSINGSPISRRQQGLTLQGIFTDVRKRLRFQAVIPSTCHSKQGRQKTLSVITTPMSGRLIKRLGKDYHV